MVPYISFVIAEEAFACERGLDSSFLAGSFDEFHQAAEFIAGELQFRVIRRPSCREYREQSPGFETKADKILLQLRKLRQAAFVDTGHHVELDFPGVDDHLDRLGSLLKRTGAPSHPVVDISESVETDGHGP